ncbi:MAG: hypothetical protein ABIB71_07380 [Candidatus Woesearchaeota archaeon]
MAYFAEELLNPLVNLWNGFVIVFPGIVAAIVILLIGYFIALILGHVIRVMLSKIGVDKGLEKVTLPKAIGKLKLSSLLGVLTKWYIFIIFIQAAVDAVNLGTLSIMLNRFVLWLPQLIIAVLAVFAGLFVAHYVSHIIEAHTAMKGTKFMSSLLKVVIIFIAIVIALEQIGIQVSILENAFLIILGSFGLGVALAIGLAFGLGLKSKAPQYLEKLKKH